MMYTTTTKSLVVQLVWYLLVSPEETSWVQILPPPIDEFKKEKDLQHNQMKKSPNSKSQS